MKPVKETLLYYQGDCFEIDNLNTFNEQYESYARKGIISITGIVEKGNWRYPTLAYMIGENAYVSEEFFELRCKNNVNLGLMKGD
jgi:hypothetical protein